jgi:hypothetical protein
MAAHEKINKDQFIDNEVDNDEEESTPESRQDDANYKAYLEYAKITPEEHKIRKERGEAAWAKVNSPEFIERIQQRRVVRNGGKETTYFNADGTMKERK